jgi:hypothetical protein
VWWAVRPPEDEELLATLFRRVSAECELGELHFVPQKEMSDE